MINPNRANSGKIAKKKFGQNFLKDEAVLHKIIESMPKDKLSIVEIGPGLGDLTRFLVEIKDVTAYEVDKDLCEHLSVRFKGAVKNGSLSLECGDVLARWDQKSLQDRPYHLVANLPYYIATNIILRALHDINCKSLLVMVQKEVAKKFSAKEKERDFSALSVLTQSVADAHICFDVPPQAFVPAPKVISSILQIIKTDSLKSSEFEDFLKVAFKQPRKTLAKNLSLRFEKKDVNSAFEFLGIMPFVRPHEVKTSLYHNLYTILLKKGNIDGRKEKPIPKTSRT